MSIANKNQYWNTRMKGENPTTSTDNPFNGSGGSYVDGYWVTTNSSYSISTTSGGAYTLLSAFSYNTAPNNNDVLLSIDNGVKKIELKSKGNTTQLDLVGNTTITISDLDLNESEDNPAPTIIRLTLDADGNAKLYLYDNIRDADGIDNFYSVVGATSSATSLSFGNNSGSVKWASVYVSTTGAFNPEELMVSDFAQDALVRMGLSVVQQLKNTNRMYLKTQVDNNSIIYGYDISSDMANRLSLPSIHVLLRQLDNGSFDSLGGSSIIQDYSVEIFVTVKDVNYENAYRFCLNIIGEVFDELYTNTGLKGSTDSITGYNTSLDVKVDDDENVCVHSLILNYQRRIKMTRR